jgi:cellulose synthase/poly-beta-1,6-N-acetylglucosamine synthase-like glycosyltransferase
MSPILASVFWIGVSVATYSYVGFPLLARTLAARRRGATAATAGDAGVRVPVSVIIPAYNEERHLEARIANILSADYPRALLEAVVVSDASTDRTNDIARRFESEGVRLIVQERRQGKTAGLNRAMAVVKGDVVVFTDANATFPPEAIGRLVSHFGDPRVGLVTGYTRYVSTATGETAVGTNAYTSLERDVKRAESLWGCCVGADGAIFAMRRSLYRRLRDDDINDFVLPLTVIDQGYRCILAEDAFCLESPGEGLHSEFRRQSRITNRSLRAIWRHLHLLNPLRFPVFSFFLFSHKVVRLAVPLFLAGSTSALMLLAARGGLLYQLLAGAAALAAVSMVVTNAMPRLFSSSGVSGRFLRLLNLFAVTNLAVIHGWWRFASGHSEVTWQHDRAVQFRE